MDEQEFDPVTGRKTTGHEWNGIKELDTPIPRVVLFFLAAGTLFSLIWWVLMPAWPLGVTYTKGLLAARPRLGSRSLGERGRLTELEEVVSDKDRGREAPTLITPRGPREIAKATS